MRKKNKNKIKLPNGQIVIINGTPVYRPFEKKLPPVQPWYSKLS